MTTVKEPVLVGSQMPTYLWVPAYEDTLGDEAIALYEQSGGVLDEWQRFALRTALALDPTGGPACFEFAIILSRQNGKNEVLMALELAWLFLFNEALIIHSAHLFETSREHFLKMRMLIEMNAVYKRRVAKITESRGAEEFLLKSGARLKFFTRKGGAGRGFTGGKLVMDECMYLDATMMAAGLPTMATKPEAQVVYTGSGGMKHSTQLASVRKRGYQASKGREQGDPALALLAWEAQKAIYNEHGELVGGDDPANPRTWAKTNPAYGPPGLGRISPAYVRREAAALGGFHSVEFGTERLGIGDYPEDDEKWEVIDKDTWQRAANSEGTIAHDSQRILAIDGDLSRGITTLGVAGLQVGGRKHFEVAARHRGSAWAVEKLLGKGRHDVYGELDLWERLGKPIVVALKNGAAADVADRLRKRGVTVESPTDMEYGVACSALVEDIKVGNAVHIDQASMNAAVGAAEKRENVEGGWRWSRDVPTDQAPIVVGTLSLWGLENFVTAPEPEIFY
jgi:phage terminase large subunit-like protein